MIITLAVFSIAFESTLVTAVLTMASIVCVLLTIADIESFATEVGHKFYLTFGVGF